LPPTSSEAMTGSASASTKPGLMVEIATPPDFVTKALELAGKSPPAVPAKAGKKDAPAAAKRSSSSAPKGNATKKGKAAPPAAKVGDPEAPESSGQPASSAGPTAAQAASSSTSSGPAAKKQKVLFTIDDIPGDDK
jgi:branched-chain amino acid transport system ATP-binding protein